jgi:hypothetical protein
MMKSKGYRKGGMKSKGYKSGGAISDSERKAMLDAKKSMKAGAVSGAVSGALKALKRELGGSISEGEREALIKALSPSKKSMGGSMKTKGYAKGGPYQGQRQQYKRTGNV